MFVKSKIIIIFLFSFIFQNSCSNSTNSTNHSNSRSVHGYIGQVSDVASYVEKLDPGLKDKIFTVLNTKTLSLKDETSLYQSFLKKMGCDPKISPIELSSDQKKEWDKVHLLFIDLYCILYKAFKSMWTDCELKKGSFDLIKEILGFMKDIITTKVVYLEEAHDSLFIKACKKLLIVFNQYYINPFNEYLNGSDFETFEKVVHRGRAVTYQAAVGVLKTIKEEDDHGKKHNNGAENRDDERHDQDKDPL